MTQLQNPEQQTGPARAPGRGNRGVWPWRDFPSLVWLAAVVVVSLVHPFLPNSRWLMVHLVLLGALTHAAMVWSVHFTQALLKTRPELDPRPRQSLRSAGLAVGVTLVFVGVTAGWWLLTLAGAVVVSVAIGWHALALWRRLRHTLAARFRVTVHYYLAAAACLPVGATFGVLLARTPDDLWRGRLLVAHTAVMVFGWVGLTVAGTLVTLWPTMLRTRLDERAERLARQALPVLGGALAVVVGGAVAGQRAVVVAGLVGYLAAALWWGRALVRPARTRAPGEFAPLSVGAALVWALGGLGWITVLVATGQDWADVGAGYGPPTAILAAGFAPQLLLGALSYLVPSVLGGGATAVRAAQAWIDRYAVARLVLVNGGLLLSLLPVPSWVRVLTTTLVLLAYTVFLPLLGLAIRASLRARTTPVERGRDADRQGPQLSSVWSSRQLVGAVAALALAVAGGVLIDPTGSGLAVTSGTDQAAGVAATGRTTTVQVQAVGMRYEPATLQVPAGDRLVIEFTNTDPTTSHDLVLANGEATPRLRPGDSATLDAGVIGQNLDGWCSVVGHRQMGMTLTVEAVGADTTTAGGSDHQGHAGNASGAAGLAPVPIDLAATPDDSFTAVDPVLAPAPTGTEHHVTLTVKEVELEVAPGVWQRRWTFNGAVPGPTLRGKVGDVFVVTLVNDGTIGHSIDFHAGALAPDQPMRTIPAGESLEYRFTATRSGIWMYHCSTMPMSVHIGAGMFGAVIIDPPDLPEVDREYVLVQSENFLGDSTREGSAAEVQADKVAAGQPDLLAFNGIAAQYDHRPLQAKVGERVRIWVLDAGPNRPSSFHIVGGQFDTTYAEGRYLLQAAPGGPDAPGGSQVLALAPAQGGFVELTFPEAGHYPMVSHLMIDAERGAHGIVEVTP